MKMSIDNISQYVAATNNIRRHFGGSMSSVLSITFIMTLALIFCCSEALAQAVNYLPQPQIKQLDSNGVNLISGDYELKNFEINLGPAQSSALATSTTIPQSSAATYLDNHGGQIFIYKTPKIYVTPASVPAAYSISIDDFTDTLMYDGSKFTSMTGTGGALVQTSANNFRYTRSNGDIATFSPPGASASFNGPLIKTLTKPDGEVVEYSYSIINGAPFLASVVSSAGISVNYTHPVISVANGLGSGSAKIWSMNRSIDYCPTDPNACVSFSTQWPSVSQVFSTVKNGTITTITVSTTGPNGQIRTKTTTADTSTYGNLGPYGDGFLKETVTEPNGTKRTYIRDSYYRVTHIITSAGTWDYSWNDPTNSTDNSLITLSVKSPTGNMTYYDNGPNVANDNTNPFNALTHIIDGSGAKTVYFYDTFGRVVQIIHPEGNSEQFSYDARGNITAYSRIPKTGSALPISTQTAGFDTACNNPVTCNKPNWVRDANGNQTDYTYDPIHGGVLTITMPANQSGIRAQTRYTYQKIITYSQNASRNLVPTGSIWRTTSSSTCQTNLSCSGTKDEIVRSISYQGSNTAWPTSNTVMAGDSSIKATSSISYDSYGNVTSETSPLGYVKNATFDANRRQVMSILPDSGSGVRTATRYTYDALGNNTQTDEGSTGPDGSNFTAIKTTLTTFDGNNRKSVVRLVDARNPTLPISFTQYSYNADDTLQCEAIRQNLSLLSAMPASACSASTSGPNGSDQIKKYIYDGSGRIIQERRGVGTVLEEEYETNTYSQNGNRVSVLDANNNLTVMYYDGLDRL